MNAFGIATGSRPWRLAALLLIALAPAAQAKDKISFAYQLDPVFEASAYAITTGKVKSDAVDVAISFIGIPALNQAAATRQYDVVMTASLSIPRGLARGIPMTILAISNRYPKTGDGANIWVAKGSPYQSLADLKGKTIGVYGIASSGITNVREILALKFGFNVDLESGDFKWVELPAPALPAALESGRIDAATLVHAQIFKAKQSGEFRSIVKLQDAAYEYFGVGLPSIVLIGYADRVAAHPEAYKAFAQMLKTSMAYMFANKDEVFGAISKKDNIDRAYFDMWFKEFGEIPFAVTADDRVGLRKSWEAAKKIGAIDEVPDVDKVIWADALTQ
jgi:NitT/TauT family transport system substrate-binding protein